MEEEQVNENILAYVNRLSDLLFVMARIGNKRGNFEETYVRFNKWMKQFSHENAGSGSGISAKLIDTNEHEWKK